MHSQAFMPMSAALEENITRNHLLDEASISGSLNSYQAEKGMLACMANLEYIEAQLLELKPETPQDAVVLLVAIMSQMEMMKEAASSQDSRESDKQLQMLRAALKNAIQFLLSKEFKDSGTWDTIRRYYIGSASSENDIQTH